MDYKSYYCDLAEVKEQLNINGVAVIKNILNENECKEAIDKAIGNPTVDECPEEAAPTELEIAP